MPGRSRRRRRLVLRSGLRPSLQPSLRIINRFSHAIWYKNREGVISRYALRDDSTSSPWQGKIATGSLTLAGTATAYGHDFARRRPQRRMRGAGHGQTEISHIDSSPRPPWAFSDDPITILVSSKHLFGLAEGASGRWRAMMLPEAACGGASTVDSGRPSPVPPRPPAVSSFVAVIPAPLRAASDVIFQMAEVAVPRWLFQAILERIRRLRPRQPVPG